MALFALTTASADTPITVLVDLKNPRSTISEDFLGLSFETQLLLPTADGRYYFRPDNRPLIALFRQLGLRSLRIGGNTADRPTVAVPGPADIDSLFGFAKAADVKVIYTLRLRAGDRDQAAAVAKYIWDHYRSQLDCFAIGNEPNVFAKEYPAYRDEWRNYVSAVTGSTNAPEAKFCGPSATPGKTSWARDFVGDFGKSGRVAFISQHDYPGGAGNRATNVVAARDQMLSAAWLTHYQKFYDSFVPVATAAGLHCRIEEANNFFNGGAKEVSDTFAATLWALDYLHWWAAHDVLGINFHTGDQVAAGEQMNTCRYATFRTTAAGCHVQPIGYGIKTFALASRGRVVSISVSSPEKINLTAYGTLAPDETLFVTLINKEHGAASVDATVNLVAGDSYVRGKVIFLSAPKSDVAAPSGVTLGGAEINEDGSWKGEWTSLTKAEPGGRFTLRIPAASAAVVQLSR
jgi:Glycosyl hydrolase family 79, N-terminal domain